MWATLKLGLQQLLQFLYDLTVNAGLPSYGIAIILLVIIVKTALYPLTAKQMRSMKAMQDIQPKVKEIQDKYKKTPDKMNQAMMELYRENKVNPMSGCLPLLVQMPILIALFQVLRDFPFKVVEHASFLWVPTLQNPDPYYILPILTAAATYWQSKGQTVSSTNAGNSQAEQTQKMMLYFMPLFIGYISLQFPAGLALYWVAFSVVGAIQNIYINRSKEPQPKGEVSGK